MKLKIYQKLLKFYSVGISTLVLKKEVFQEYKFNNKFHIIGDFDLVMKLAKKFKFGASEKCLSNYRIHENNEIFIKKK